MRAGTGWTDTTDWGVDVEALWMEGHTRALVYTVYTQNKHVIFLGFLFCNGWDSSLDDKRASSEKMSDTIGCRRGSSFVMVDLPTFLSNGVPPLAKIE